MDKKEQPEIAQMTFDGDQSVLESLTRENESLRKSNETLKKQIQSLQQYRQLFELANGFLAQTNELTNLYHNSINLYAEKGK